MPVALCVYPYIFLTTKSNYSPGIPKWPILSLRGAVPQPVLDVGQSRGDEAIPPNLKTTNCMKTGDCFGTPALAGGARENRLARVPAHGAGNDTREQLQQKGDPYVYAKIGQSNTHVFH